VSILLSKRELDRLKSRLTSDYVESLLALTHVRCPIHNEYVATMTRDGWMTFYCGCPVKTVSTGNRTGKRDLTPIPPPASNLSDRRRNSR